MRKSQISALVVCTLFSSAILAFANRLTSNRSQNTADPALIARLSAAHKEAIGKPLVINGEAVCGPTGDSNDQKMQELDNNKNRTDEPGQNEYIPVDWDAMKNLPADGVANLQGAPVQVTGFLSHEVKVEKGKGESTNPLYA